MMSRVGPIAVLVLVGAGLILLQIAVAGHGLLSALPSYALFGAAALIAAASWRSTNATNPLCLVSVAIFAIWIVIRAVTSPANYMARHDLYAILGAVVLYGLVLTVLSTPGRRFVLLLILLGFALCHVILGLVQFGHGQNFMFFSFMEALPITQRAAGFYLNPDHLAGLLELLGILALSVACWSRLPKWSRVIFGYLALACYVGVALTASRGGYVSVAISLVVFTILSGMVLRSGGVATVARYGSIGLIILIGAVAIPAVMLHQTSSLRDRVANIASPDNTRFDLWRAAVAQWKMEPLTGTGSGTYRYFGRLFRAERMQLDPVMVHNDYLQLLCEYGLVGVAAFLFLCGSHLRNGWRNFAQFGARRVSAGSGLASDRLAFTIGAFSALGAYAFHSAVDFNMHNPPNAMIVAIVFAFLANPGARPQEQNAKPLGRRQPLPWILGAVGAVLFVQCLRLIPGEYYSERANAALENEHPEEAISFAQQALRFEKRNPDIYFSLGRAEEALHDAESTSAKGQPPPGVSADHYYLSALADFERARALSPLEEAYPLDLAWAYDQLGRFPEAEWMFCLARGLDPRLKAIDSLYQAHLDMWRNAR